MEKEKEYMLVNVIYRSVQESEEVLFATVRTNQKTGRKRTLAALLQRIRQRGRTEAFVFALDSIVNSSRCIESFSFAGGKITVIHLCRLELCENEYLKAVLTGILYGAFPPPPPAKNPAFAELYEKLKKESAESGEADSIVYNASATPAQDLPRKHTLEELPLIAVIGGKIKFF